MSRKVPGHLSKKKGDLPSESVGVAEIGRSGRHTDDGYRVALNRDRTQRMNIEYIHTYLTHVREN